jgi:beta-glucosidase
VTASTHRQLTFSPDFRWGAATAAHQVEGGNVNNDWWRWEQQPGRIKNGDRSGLACDHYRRYPEDFDLLAELRHTAHRLSIEWSRIEPSPGQFDPEVIAHYRAVLTALRERGMEPFVTLHHFTNPLWLADAGGWLRPGVVQAFERFVTRMALEYRDYVRHWVTINEPTVYAYFGYVLGLRPPGVRNLRAALQVMRHFVSAHAHAYRAIKSVDPDALVGMAHHRTLLDPIRPRHPLDRLVARFRLWLMDELWPAATARGRVLGPLRLGRAEASVIGSYEDFIGINYYTRGRTRFDLRTPGLFFGREVLTQVPRNAVGWELYPEGLYRVLLRAAAVGRAHSGQSPKPVVITENGVADRNDELRPAYLVQHLAAVHRAIEAGVPVGAYLHWTSMDNFEWTEGFEPRFGLIEVDFNTQERQPKPSAHLYAEIIRRNALTAEMLERYPVAPATEEVLGV